jgi:hypothetical protein
MYPDTDVSTGNEGLRNYQPSEKVAIEEAAIKKVTHRLAVVGKFLTGLDAIMFGTMFVCMYMDNGLINNKLVLYKASVALYYVISSVCFESLSKIKHTKYFIDTALQLFALFLMGTWACLDISFFIWDVKNISYGAFDSDGKRDDVLITVYLISSGLQMLFKLVCAVLVLLSLKKTYLHDKAAFQKQLLNTVISSAQLDEELQQSQFHSDPEHALYHHDPHVQNHLIDRFQQIRGVTQDGDMMESQPSVGVSTSVFGNMPTLSFRKH